MRILITGGAGCLGSNLIEHWLPHGYDILVIDNFATGRREVVPGGLDRLTVVEATIADAAAVDRAFDAFKPACVIHSAAAYRDPDDWREDVATNVIGSINVVEAAKRHGVRRFINFQTSLCYGKPERVPVPLDHPCRPVASYGISKTAGESYVMLSGLPFVSLRLASVIGPRLAIGAIPTFYARLKAGKSVFCTTAVRDFLDMSDFLAFMDGTIEEGGPTGVFNLGPGIGHSIQDVLVAVANAMKVAVPTPIDVRPVGADDVETVVLDPSITRAAFGWRHKVQFDEAIARMVRWYDQFGVSAVHSHLKAAGHA
jgi:nucleoside-diphosphate-sugar epimerase